MPGLTLAYGCVNLASKVWAFLWALFLLVGPSMEVLEYWLGKVASITTDMGRELGIAGVENVLPAFLKVISGRPTEALSDLVITGSRLFKRALRIPDWSHLFANVMHYATKSITRWPKIEAALRALCLFFRNKTYRMDLVKHLTGRVAHIGKRLKHFTARMLKWRYEPYHQVFFQLNKLRDICETYLVYIKDILRNSQEGELLSRVAEACSWNELWVFISAYLNAILDPLEMARHWGLVCACPEHQLLRDQIRNGHLHNRRIECHFASMRLKEAIRFYFNLVDNLAVRGREVTLEHCNDPPATTPANIANPTWFPPPSHHPSWIFRVGFACISIILWRWIRVGFQLRHTAMLYF